MMDWVSTLVVFFAGFISGITAVALAVVLFDEWVDNQNREDD